MTKRLFNLTKVALLIFSIAFIFNSCTTEEYYENPTNWNVQDFVVNENMWKWDNTDECYYCEFKYPALTNFVAEEGAITVSAYIDGTFRPLQFTTYFYNENGRYLSETVNYEYGDNFIRFNVTASDLFDNVNIKNYKPGKYIFKSTLIW